MRSLKSSSSFYCHLRALETPGESFLCLQAFLSSSSLCEAVIMGVLVLLNIFLEGSKLFFGISFLLGCMAGLLEP